MRLLNQAIALNPTNSFALLNRCALTIGNIDAHHEYHVILEVLDREPANQFGLFCLATYYGLHLYSDEALAVMRQLVAVNPHNDAAEAGLAILLSDRDDDDEAVVHACRALALNPQNWQAFDVISELGFPGEAAEYKDLNPDSSAPSSTLPGILGSTPLWRY